MNSLPPNLKSLPNSNRPTRRATTSVRRHIIFSVPPLKSSRKIEIGLERFGQSIAELEGLRQNLMSETELLLVNPIEEFLKTDITSLHDSRRKFQKSNDDYDNALLKYLGRKPSQPANALNEARAVVRAKCKT